MTLTEVDKEILEKLRRGERIPAEAMDHCESIAQLMVDDFVRLDEKGCVVLTEFGRQEIEAVLGPAPAKGPS